MAPGPEIDWAAVWRGDSAVARPYIADGMEVATIEGSGRGVRAKVRFAAGDLLLAEQALATAPEAKLPEVLFELQGSLDTVKRSQLDLMCDGTCPAALASPVDFRRWPGALLPQGDVPAPLALPRLRRIVDLNAYRCSPPRSQYAFVIDRRPEFHEDVRPDVYGLFPLGSLVNHTCAPNLSKVLLDDWVFLRAARDILPWEELTQFYCDVRMPVELRRSELQDLFGFHCTCRRCAFEAELVRAGEDALAPWLGLYSCQVPATTARGTVQTSHLEGIVAQAERAARDAVGALRSRRAAAGQRGDASEQDDWSIWPLVPAFSQLAERLRLDGRLVESVELWRRACHVVESVVPSSNIHLRVLGELLLTEAQRGHDDAIRVALDESRRATAIGYGGGVDVWHQLVGFRMPQHVLALAADAGVARTSAVADGVVEQLAHIDCKWGAVQRDPSSGLRRATLTARLPCAAQAKDVHVDASHEALLIAAPGAAAVRVECPLGVDLERMVTKFSSKRRELTVAIVERAEEGCLLPAP